MGKKAQEELAEAHVIAASDQATPAERFRACEVLVRFGVVEPALPVLRNLESDAVWAPAAGFLRRTAEYIRRRGLANEMTSVQFAEDEPDGVALGDAALWRSRDPQRCSESLLIVFVGRDKSFWVSLDMLHRIIRDVAGQALYLRDFAGVYFLAGIDPYRSYQSTLSGLKGVVERAAVRKVCLLGLSAGGFAALKYGLDLSAHAVLALSPLTDVRYAWGKPQTREQFERYNIPIEWLDVLPFYEQAERRPEVTIVYGELNQRDDYHARRLAHIPGVCLRQIPELSLHNSFAHLLGTGRFERLVRELLTQ
jgi:hypothetical protein